MKHALNFLKIFITILKLWLNNKNKQEKLKVIKINKN